MIELTIEVIAEHLNMPVLGDLSGYRADEEFVGRVPIQFAREHRLIGLWDDADETMRIAFCDASGLDHVDVLGRHLGASPPLLPASAAAIDRAVNAAYTDRASQAQSVVDALSTEDLLRDAAATAGDDNDLLDSEGRAPIIRLVNHLLLDAVKVGASDVHIQPYEDRVVVRQRIDGVLFDCFEIPKAVQEEVLTRLKVLGKMNIAEKRLPQDGRATVSLGDRVVDLRIASLPTSHNERIVVRLLDKSARLYSLTELGMPPEDLSRFAELVDRDHGMVLVTGPTGSGKSTTLYGVLQQMNSHDMNVLTLEDPIEYALDGISQTQINEKKGMTFASGMRSVLRQDPDVIMVGEIRDGETAVMAIQASLTGHLVLSTLHTNDAASAVTRLLDLGIEPYLVSSSLVGVLAQRLVRRLCDHCKAPDGETTFAAVGCQRCRGTGFRGRVGLFELLRVDDRIRDLVVARAAAAEIRAAAIDGGTKLLATDGVEKVRQGVTTMDEVLRVTTL